MSNVWFTADTHFSHLNVIKYCNRPFSSVEEMNEVMINNWNSVVKSNSTIYHLGDFGLGAADSLIRDILPRLNGKKILIAGGHDKDFVKAARTRGIFEGIYDLLTIKYNRKHIILCHYPMRMWYRSHLGSWHLHGHVHRVETTQGKICNVGVDVHNFMPISIDEILTILKD